MTLPLFKHQQEIFDNTKDLSSYGILWSPGVGKSAPTLHTAAHLFREGKIDAVMIVAPNGVHRNWLTDELPKHLDSALPVESHLYDSNRSGSKKATDDRERLLKHQGLAVLAITYDGLVTERGKAYAKRFLTQRKCLYVLDEAHYIKTPGSKRTKTILASSKYAPYKRLLTGTPVAEGPFDLYSQLKFLNENFWKQKKIGSFAAFKAAFGVFVRREFGPRSFNQLVNYKDLDRLHDALKESCSRLTKEDAGLNLPEKLYTKRYFELTPEQKRIYNSLRDELRAELSPGVEIQAPLALTKLLRLQQITCGYVGVEDQLVKIDGPNPRLESLIDILDATPGQVIIWTRFTEDINQICARLGSKATRYDGTQTAQEAAESKEAFQRGEYQYFVANSQKGAEGLTLNMAQTAIYYSNSFRLVHRDQSENRNHRVGQKNNVLYIDLVAQDSVDEQIVEALRDKFDIASQITGDRLRDWI